MPVLERHSILTADGVSLVVHRATPEGPVGAPVLLVPGTFSTHHFWVGDRGQGLAVGLAEAGFDPWILDLRGHGESERPRRWTMEDWIRYDAPAAVAEVSRARADGRVFWLGHSGGGVIGAAFAGSGHAAAGLLAGLVLMGSPGPVLGGVRRAGAAGIAAVTALLPFWHVPGWLVGLGPEHEPAELIRHWLGWNLAGRWSDPAGGDYLDPLRRTDAPVLAIAGAADRYLAPPAAVRDLLNRFGSVDRTLIVAGLEYGFSIDFDHPGLVIGGNAKREIWPRIIEWLADRSRRQEEPTPLHPGSA